MLFNACWLYLNLVKDEDEDFVIYTGVVNRECEKMNELTSNLFKCLIFVEGLIANKDAEIR